MSQPDADRAAPLVIVLDDDDAVCAALKFSLELQGYRVSTCGSGEALLDMELPQAMACLVIDQRLPGISGLKTLQELRRRHVALPAALITTQPPRALRSAAAASQVAIIEKPLLDQALKLWIRDALAG